jgi:metal-sulfur cluster biosynthetic enzyme
MTDLRNDVLKALDQVVDPTSGRTVVQQDMIQGLVVKDGHVGFVLEVAPDRAAASEGAAQNLRSDGAGGDGREIRHRGADRT